MDKEGYEIAIRTLIDLVGTLVVALDACADCDLDERAVRVSIDACNDVDAKLRMIFSMKPR